MSSLLPLGEIRGRVGELDRILRQARLRDGELREERRSELEALAERYAILRARARDAFQREQEALRSAHQGEEERLNRRGQERRDRIERAHRACRKALEESLEGLREQRRYQNQKILLEASRACEQRNREAEARCREALARIEGQRTGFMELFDRCQRLLRGYRSFRLEQEGPLSPEPSTDPVERLVARMEEASSRFAWRILPALFARIRWWLLAALVAAGGALARLLDGGESIPWEWIGAGCLAVLFGYGLGWWLGRGPADDLARISSLIERGLEDGRQAALEEREAALQEASAAYARTEEELEAAWRVVDAEAKRRAAEELPRLQRRALSLAERHQTAWEARLEAHRRHRPLSRSEGLARLEKEEVGKREELNRDFDRRQEEWERDWRGRAQAVWDQLERASVPVPAGQTSQARIGELRFPGPGGRVRSVPLALGMPGSAALVLETRGAAPSSVSSFLCGLLVRLLSASPPGGIDFALFDPVGLGRSFAGLMHLSDQDPRILGPGIHTQAQPMEQRLKDLALDMERITQMCLRRDHDSLSSYNRQAGSMAERYRYLMMADFPAQLGEGALATLRSLLAGGPRCGIFLILHRDLRLPLGDPGLEEDLDRHGQRFRWGQEGVSWQGLECREARVLLDDPPPVGEETLRRLGREHSEGFRVEAPFELVSPSGEEIWSRSSLEHIQVPLGRASASRLQQLVLGRGLEQHALVVGKTGSGKSNLLHVLITSLSLWCSPREVEFYLVDYKKGVEFKCYAAHRLPHARVVAIESDRDFGLSVLQRVDRELHRRGELFRQAQVRDLAEYRRRTGRDLPRTLLLVDEFQEYFVEDDALAQIAATLLDRIVRQGRAFGIHAILGSQTLGGGYTMARATFAQMNIRIALQCDEADAALAMDEDNTAPRLLSRPGEGIYNDGGGALERNSRFQAAWLPDQERDAYLETLRKRAPGAEGPVVFEGNAPADLRRNALLASALDGSLPGGGPPRCWLGEPNAIKGPTEVAFEARADRHLLILGQNREMARSLLASALVSLAASDRRARFWFLGSAAEHRFLEGALAATGGRVRLIAEEGLEELAAGSGSAGDASRFLFVPDVQFRSRLKPRDEFDLGDGAEGPDAWLREILENGAARGLHAVVSADSYPSAVRWLTRKSLQEFGAKVLLQMGAADSAALIDSTRANALGLHRALLHLESEGEQEVFRPYAPPGAGWLEEAGRRLRDA